MMPNEHSISSRPTDFTRLLEQITALAVTDAAAAATAVTNFLSPRPATLMSHRTDAWRTPPDYR